jgi:glycosyltransferase involved in cell wall biosynthesis
MSLASPTAPIRLGVICDYLEERWPSMDLMPEMILRHLAERHASEILAERIRPPWRNRLVKLPGLGKSALARNADRVWNRHLHYPRQIREYGKSNRFDLFHLVDHSYAQLLHELPMGRTIVTCHDLDTFKCLLEPACEPRPKWFKALANRSLTGFQKAAAIACNSEATYAAILRYELLPKEKLRVVHVAVHPACTPRADTEFDARAAAFLGPPPTDLAPELLHVGSNIPRKRIDVLLNVFAQIQKAIPGARLIKVGGRFTPEQQNLAESLKIAAAITFVPYVDPEHYAVIAAIYRRASLLLQTSDSEGFGLPVAEAMACGTVVLASDLPILREVGGDAAIYRPVAASEDWADAAVTFLKEKAEHSQKYQERRAESLRQAARFSWNTHVDMLMQMYRDVLDVPLGLPSGRII